MEWMRKAQQWFRQGLGLFLALSLLLVLLVAGTQAGYTQGQPPPAGDTVIQAARPGETIDCDHPPTGRKAKLFADNEIAVVFRADKHKNLELFTMDNSGKNLVWEDNWFFSREAAYTDIRWPAVTTADLDDDGKREMVMAFRDKEKRIAAGTPRESGDHDVLGSFWYSDASPDKGGNVEWIDVAAGNLDGHYRQDTREEVVIAFADDNHDLRVLTVNGPQLEWPNAIDGVYGDDSSNGRGSVKYVAVATGDLDGDGYDNEIVTAFRDGNKHLQCLILRRPEQSGTLEVLWSKTWTDHDRGDVAKEYADYGNVRPIDVTVGDIDGDKHDEVVLAFRDAYFHGDTLGKVQLLALDYTGVDAQGGLLLDDSVFIQRDPAQDYDSRTLMGVAPTSVSVSAADLDGDGRDEVAVGYNVVWNAYGPTWQQHLLTYEHVPPPAKGWQGCLDDQGNARACLQARPGHWKSSSQSVPLFASEKGPEARLVLDTGDLDLDGKVEIALARRNHQGEIEVRSFDADSGLGQRSLLSTTFEGADSVEEFWLAMGDVDGDTLYANYTGQCYETQQSQVQAVIHSPPYWPEDNDAHTHAGFGMSVGSGGGTGETTETSMGGSVAVKALFKEVGPSFTTDWETSCAVEKAHVQTTVEGTGFETHPPYLHPQDPYMDAVGYLGCPRWCYEYTDSKDNSPITVCLPRPANECAYGVASLEAWYKDYAQKDPPYGVGDSWVPLGRNLARGRPTQQSSNYNATQGHAELAVDGNTDGVFSHNSVTHTSEEQAQPWWQVDLGIAPTIHAVQLWNRTDCCAERLSDFYVFVSEEPFTSNDPNALVNDPSIWRYDHEGAAGRLTTVAWSDFTRPGSQAKVTGRHVRVQLAGTDPLSLAEVRVWGVPAEVDQWPVEAPTADDKTFTIKLRDGSQQTVDGEFITSRQAGLLLVNDQGSPEWDTSKGEEWEQMTETSTAATAKVGFSIRVAEGEYTTGSKDIRSQITTWSEETEFSGIGGAVEEEPWYKYAPYVWLQRAVSSGDVEQAFLVVDYWVPWIGESAQAEGAAAPSGAAGPAPLVPLIDSPTHPHPEAWYPGSTATFTWAQPPGDPATVTGYRWYLDRSPDTVPAPRSMGLTTSHTYNNLRDGVWYLHVRAQGDGGEWSGAAHRAIRVDANPPEVELALDPPLPTGHSGWYNTPLTVTVTATDTAGSGVAAVEVSTDGAAWQPYAAPWRFDADTAGTTVWARASDVAGHTSEPVSTTFKIDLTPPSSKTPGGPMPGAWFAGIVIDALGNEHPILAGAIDDALSGQEGMDLEVDGLDRTSASRMGSWHPFPDRPEVEVTWYYTGTAELGRGNHIFQGRAHDQAGNLEEPYELARLVWFPQGSPDLEGSALVAWPETARPGDEVLFVVAVRNHGTQEAWVDVADTLPQGLTPVTGLMARDAVYDPSSRTLTWPPRLLWPGEWHRFHFRARVDEGLGATALENRATARAFWPNTDELPPAEHQRFQDREQTVNFTTTVTVDPNLAAGADVTAPWAGLYVHSGHALTEREVELGIVAAADARWMYLREWTLDPDTGEWVVAQNSGWMAYSRTHTWSLSPGAGVKYLGVWVADGAWNVSALGEHSLAFTNLLTARQALSDGQRHQYRFDLARGDLAIYNLVAHRGDPDLYVWNPRHALRPNHVAEGTQLADVVALRPHETGVHLFEVIARADSMYQLLPVPSTEVDLENLEAETVDGKVRPDHPLTVSDPLSAGSGVEAPALDLYQRYLPLIYKTR